MCLIETLLAVSTVATMLVNPALLIAPASISASAEAPVAVNDTVFAVCNALLFAKVS